MKTAILCALALGLSGCAGIPLVGGNGDGASAQALKEFLESPQCAHHDEATFVSGAGGIPASFQAKVSRDCPAQVPPPAATVWGSPSEAPH